MKIVLTILLFIHGLIHFMGFAKAYEFGKMATFTKEISRPMGLLWLLTGLLFIIVAISNLMKKEYWPILAIAAVSISQILIITAWTDAKYGTIANVIVLIAAIIAYGTHTFENDYKKDVVFAMEKMVAGDDIITEEDLEPLPNPVQNYLRYVGVVGKPKVRSFKMVFEGEMRDRGKEWFKFTSEQYNFFETPTRLFFMKAKVRGLPTSGYHAYKKDGATMKVKVLSLFPVIDIEKPELFKTETVTFFNDLCLFAPAALMDKRITWQNLGDRSAEAVFTTNTTRISAKLYFNEKGQLINFVSENRMAIDEMKNIPFSTPIRDYENVNGFTLSTYGEAVWHYPEEEFVYGKFHLKSLEYNVSELD